MKRPQEIVSQTSLAAAVVFSEVWPIIVRHKKTVFIIVVFEVWVHGLAIHHAGELKSLMELFPFFGN